jgi:hypothetical protein
MKCVYNHFISLCIENLEVGQTISLLSIKVQCKLYLKKENVKKLLIIGCRFV